MSLQTYGVIQVPDTTPTGAGGQLLMNNDKALNDARGVRMFEVLVESSGMGSEPALSALVSEVGLAGLNTSGITHKFGHGAVNLQSVFTETIYHSPYNKDGDYSTISGGYCNFADGSYAVVIGGCNNNANAMYSIAGGKGSAVWGYGSVALGCQHYVSSQYTAIIGGYSCSASGDYSGVIGCESSNTSASHSVVLAGKNITGNYDDTYGIIYGNGGDSIATGRSVIRGLATSSATATVLTLNIASLSSAGASLVEVDVLHGNGSTFKATQYLVKVIGTDFTVIDYRGDGGEGSASQGSFGMVNGTLTYTSENPLNAMRANVRITTMSSISNPYNNYYYYG